MDNICFPDQGTKLEVESILREVCERVLEDTSISREKAELRAVALQLLGEAYTSVKKEEPNQPPGSKGFGDESEYVRVDTKSSRARESQPRHTQDGR